MNTKQANRLTVGLVILLVLTPSLITLGWIWQWHLDLVQSQPTAVSQTNLVPASQSFLPTSSEPQLTSCRLGSFEEALTDTTPPIRSAIGASPLKQVTPLLAGFSFLTPLGFCAWITVYERYRLHRAALLKEQVALLEKLWQQST